MKKIMELSEKNLDEYDKNELFSKPWGFEDKKITGFLRTVVEIFKEAGVALPPIELVNRIRNYRMTKGADAAAAKMTDEDYVREMIENSSLDDYSKELLTKAGKTMVRLEKDEELNLGNIKKKLRGLLK